MLQMGAKRIVKYFLPYGMVKVLEKRKRINASTAGIEPVLFNQDQQRKRTFFLADAVCVHSPYSFSSIDTGKTKYIHWDRFNRALPIHFYSHEQMLSPTDLGKKNFGIIVESETIVPKLYSKLLDNPELVAQYDGIFTHSERLLKKYSNAYFIPGSSVWYGGTAGGGSLSDEAYKCKSKNISLVSSHKVQCPLHAFRLHLAQLLSKDKDVDVMGTFAGGKFVRIADSLEDYRFSIAIENNITSCYFTEKLLNCFAAMTIPIYVGATDLGTYFDPRGIVMISPKMTDTEILETIHQCTQEFYNSRRESVRNNYEMVKKYFCIEDYIYEHYGTMFD